MTGKALGGSIKALKVTALVCIIALVLMAATQPFRNYRAAHAHIPIVARALEPYPQFRDVHTGYATSGGGAFVVHGAVQSTNDLTRLRTIVMATHPPIKVRFLVRVTDHPERTPSVATP